jgi:tRNA (guanine37-N1)-methyltransferase
MVLLDSVTRLIPGVLGMQLSGRGFVFFGGWLDCPHYTQPEEIAERRVPVLLE